MNSLGRRQGGGMGSIWGNSSSSVSMWHFNVLTTARPYRCIPIRYQSCPFLCFSVCSVLSIPHKPRDTASLFFHFGTFFQALAPTSKCALIITTMRRRRPSPLFPGPLSTGPAPGLSPLYRLSDLICPAVRIVDVIITFYRREH